MNNKLLVVKEVERVSGPKEGAPQQTELSDIYALLEEWLSDAKGRKTNQ